jgi:excinuclease ABC subunit C
MFLKGESFSVIEELGEKMEQSSMSLEFEKAAQYRDRISALRTIQSQHLINQPQDQDLDVLVLDSEAGHHVLCLMMYRGGNLWGSENYYPKVRLEQTQNDVLSAFISQHYQQHPCPKTLLLNEALTTDIKRPLVEHISHYAKHKVTFKKANTKTEQGLIALAQTNARNALKQYVTQKSNQSQRLKALQEVLMLKKLPNHMECFDISHTMGQQTTASCVVFDEGVPNTKNYRQFNIDGIEPGDDYAAMRQAIERRYSRLKTENKALPDLIVVDGGKGQLNQAIDILKGLELEHIPLVSVAKGEGRKAGLEILYTPYNFEGIDLEADDIALHLINHIRDEAHRFAITRHRHKRTKTQTQSSLEQIEGIGPKTRKALLLHFGGLGEIKNAAVMELAKVKGVSKEKAQRIYDNFHGD